MKKCCELWKRVLDSSQELISGSPTLNTASWPVDFFGWLLFRFGLGLPTGIVIL